MPRVRSDEADFEHDDWPADGQHESADDADDPLESDRDDDPDAELSTDTCTSCGREIISDVVQCPHCGEFAPTQGAAPRPGSWWWFGWIAVLLVFVTAGWIWVWIAT